MKNDFDFNMLFYEGVYFISREDVVNLEGSRQLGEIKSKFRADTIEESLEYKAFRDLNWDLLCSELDKIFEKKLEKVETKLKIKFVKLRVYKYFEALIEEKYKNLKIEFSYDHDFLPKRKELNIEARLKLKKRS